MSSAWPLFLTLMANVLFPVLHTQILAGFTTCPTVSLPHITHVAFSNSELGVHRASKNPHHIVTLPQADTSHPRAWEADFAKGSINPSNKTAPPGGFGFYVHGPKAFRHELERHRERQEVVLSYEVLLEDGWGWQKGGKLPGICAL